jgi:hypothetical protein
VVPASESEPASKTMPELELELPELVEPELDPPVPPVPPVPLTPDVVPEPKVTPLLAEQPARRIKARRQGRARMAHVRPGPGRCKVGGYCAFRMAKVWR